MILSQSATQNILVLDLSTPTPRADLLSVYGKSLELLESAVSNMRDIFGRNALGATFHPPVTADENQEAPSGPTCAWPPPNPAQDNTVIENASSAVKELISKIKQPWMNSVLIIPPYDYLSLNLKLPFAQDKLINRVLTPEAQDKVPFDLSEFILSHRVLGADDKGQFDIHVSMVPKEAISKSLQICKSVALEPILVTTPQSSAAALAFIMGGQAGSSVLLCENDPFYFLALFDEDANIVSDRVIERISSEQSSDTINFRGILSDLRTTLKRFEDLQNQRGEGNVNTALNRIFYLGQNITIEEMSQMLARPLEELHSAEYVKGTDRDVPLGMLSALYAQEAYGTDAPPAPYTNFRIKEFAYSPKLQNFLSACKQIAVPIVSTLLLMFAAMLMIYWSRHLYINSIKTAIGQRVKELVPNISVPEGMELDALRNETINLETQLKELGSLSRYSPLDTLFEITSDFPTESGVALKGIQIKNSKIRIEGVSPDVSAREAIEREIKTKRDKYCHVEAKQSGSSSSAFGNAGMRGFIVDLVLCD